MKTKILKKLLAVACAATMSAATIPSVGAITTTAQLSASDKNQLEKLNTMIKSYFDVLQTIQGTISSWKQDTEIQQTNKSIALSQVDYVKENLKKINQLATPDVKLLQKINGSLLNLNVKIFELSQLAESVKNTNEYDDINFDFIELNKNIKDIYDQSIKYIHDFNNMNNMNRINNSNNMNNMNHINNSNNINNVNNMNRINNFNNMNNMNHINNFNNMNHMNHINNFNNMNHINNFNNMNHINNFSNMNMMNNIATLISVLKQRNFPMNYNDISLSPKNQKLMSYASTNDMIKCANQIVAMDWNSQIFGLNHIMDTINCVFDISSDAFINEANTEIDSMLMQAKNNMPPVDINALEQKFKNIHAGMQSFSNCWLFSAQNVINYYKFFKAGEQPIIKAPANGVVDPFAESRDIVEQEFINHGGDPTLLRQGRHYNYILDYLSKYNMSTSSLQLVNSDRSVPQRKIMPKIAELLLLRHFISYESPVIILNQGHYVTICGVDAKSDQALVIDSCHKDLRKISLSKLCIDAAQSLSVDSKSENLILIFTSIAKPYPETRQYFADKPWQDFKSFTLDKVFKE